MNVYRVNFSYVAPNHKLRSGSVVYETDSPEKARALAEEQLTAEFKFLNITGVALYFTNDRPKAKGAK